MRWPEFKARIEDTYRRALARARGWKTVRRPDSARAAGGSRYRGLKWTAGIFAGLITVIVLILATLDWNLLRGPVGRYLSGRMHREVTLGHLDVKLFSWTPTAYMKGLVISQPDWVAGNFKTPNDFADIERLIVSVDLRRLLTWDLVLPEVTVQSPRVQMLRDASGRANWNFSEDKNAKAFHLPAIQHFIIRDGKLDVTDIKRRLTFTGTVSSEEQDGAAGTQYFSLLGQGQLNQAPFQLDLRGDPLLNVDPDDPYGFDAHIRAGATRIDAKGSLDHPFDLGAFKAAANFVGQDLADLYFLTGLALPNTPAYHLTGRIVRDEDNWKIDGLDGTVGSSDLRGTLAVDASGDIPYLKADLASRKLDFADLAALTGAKVKGAGAQKVVVVNAAIAGGLLPDVPLQIQRVRQMNADVHYRADAVISREFPMRMAETNLSLKDGVLKLAPVSFTFSHGTLNGNVEIDARKDVPVSDVDLRLSNLRLDQFAPGVSGAASLEGVASAHARLHGVGNSIHKAASTASGSVTVAVPHGEIRKSFAELLGINVASALGLILSGDQRQTGVRCAVAEFSASNGVMQLRQFVFDTPVVLASGEGTIDLRNERINLAIKGHPKKFELIRLRSPITITGSLAHPAVGVQAGPAIAQTGIAAALGALVTPLVAVLPFLDPGLAKDANCGALLAQAQSQGVRVAQAQPNAPVAQTRH